MSEGFDRLKEELELSKTKVESLETNLADKETQHIEKVKGLSEEYESALNALTEQLDQAKISFETEKQKIEQSAQDQMTKLKGDLDATLAEKGEMQQKEILDKQVEAHEKQEQLKKDIDHLNSNLEKLTGDNMKLESQVRKEQEEVERLMDQNRQ